MILYHGTTEVKGKKIQREGFVPDKSYNWEVHSKEGFVYLSYAYAPFYAMQAKGKGKNLALIQVDVSRSDWYPDDDFVMLAVFGKHRYSQKDLDEVDLEDYKYLAFNSFKYLGNVAVKTKVANKGIKGVRFFDGSRLFHYVDPTITPLNYAIMGKYYHDLSQWIYKGKDYNKFPTQGELMMRDIERANKKKKKI